MKDTTSSAPCSKLEQVFNHIVLPPRLPGKAETCIDDIHSLLLSFLQKASEILTNALDGGPRDIGLSISKTLEICKSLNVGGRLDKAVILREFARIEPKVPLILHVKEQNAGLLIWRDTQKGKEDTVVFEAFEASAVSEKVLAAEGPLQWDFPGEAVEIPYTVFTNPSFQESISSFLERASTESIKRFAACVQKAGAVAFENRDTTDPAIITQMLMTLLEANGSRIFPPLLRKRVRDDVSWAPGGEKPWRRLPFWLVVRVGIERHLRTQFGDVKGRVYYKFLLCLMISDFLENITGQISPDKLFILKAKLARRLSKLEMDREKAQQNDKAIYGLFFTKFEDRFRTSIESACRQMENQWENFKCTFKRKIPRFPKRADTESQYLSLTNSKTYIKDVLSQYERSKSLHSTMSYSPISFDPHQKNAFRAFAKPYNELSELEASTDEDLLGLGTDSKSCKKIASMIEMYLAKAESAYDGNPEQKSIMILHTVRLWMIMDLSATQLFPLLLDYHPGISPDLLDVLHLPSLRDMKSLNKVQNYIHTRCTRSLSRERRTIFDDPVERCFAERFFDSSEGSELQELHAEITSQAAKAHEDKVREWQVLSDRFEALRKRISISFCTFTTNESGRVDHDHDCEKCHDEFLANRMTITIDEHPLPKNTVHAKAVVFELRCPEAFRVYRDLTWRVFGILTCPQPQPKFIPRLLIGKYCKLEKFATASMAAVTLASTTKSLLSTHYRGVHFPVRLEDICFENNLKLKYYDTKSETLVNRQSCVPSFTHHLRLNSPMQSPFASIAPPGGLSGSSSYEIIASQASCPANLNAHEFLAYKSLFSGKATRWPSILVEIGSSNLNFSTKAPSLLVCQLAVQAGPRDENNPFRVIHKAFRDESFCTRLSGLISERLEGITSNWRETDCMEMLVTLILRLCVLGPMAVLPQALDLLKTAQNTLVEWVRQLRNEICTSQDPAIIANCSEFAFINALILRKTFFVYAEGIQGYTGMMTPTDTRLFIEASISLQDNAPNDLKSLAPLLKNALIRDLKMVNQMRSILLNSLKHHQESLGQVIASIWSRGASECGFFGLKQLDSDGWFQLEVNATYQTRQQTIHFHLLEGHLLVDGHPLGALPANHRNSMTLDRLFGNQRLLVFPSSLHDMTYRIPFEVNGHAVHIGFRGGTTFVRAQTHGAIYEYIPREVFGDKRNFDLPGSLIEDCIHWLDLSKGLIKVRNKSSKWFDKDSHWEVDFHKRKAHRRRSTLIDPHSQVFRQVTSIFEGFEYPAYITIFQPSASNLSVELRRLGLDFIISESGLLKCKQLNAVIDPNQDAGTWYGLNSKLVLMDVSNMTQRSIIVPMGPVRSTRNGIHVSVLAENVGAYGRFFINDCLGRLDCPTEPWMLYAKAQFHAYTAFVLPDRLTGRTGTEEAVHCLRSGYCQPWTTLNMGPKESLISIARLTPTRVYYPPGSNTMQHATWNDDLTPVIQHEIFQSLVERICGVERILASFAAKAADKSEQPMHETPNDEFLTRRAYRRRNNYQRPDAGFDELTKREDKLYEPRDRFQSRKRRDNVFECSNLIKIWSPNPGCHLDLVKTFEGWNTIGGYCEAFDKVLLTDIFEVEINKSWGSIANYCRATKAENKYNLMITMALMTFHDLVDMSVIRALITFATVPALNSLSPPKWIHYQNFRYNQQPTMTYLQQLISSCRIPYVADDHSGLLLSAKTKKRLQAAQKEHEDLAEKDSQTFLNFIYAQWPCLEPSIEGIPATRLLDVSRALKVILPDWARLFQNLELSTYLAKVQATLISDSNRKLEQFYSCAKSMSREIFYTRVRGEDIPTLANRILRNNAMPSQIPLLEKSTGASEETKPKNSLFTFSVRGPSIGMKSSLESGNTKVLQLEMVAKKVQESYSLVRQQYGQDLMLSLKSLKDVKVELGPTTAPFNLLAMNTKIDDATREVQVQFEKIKLMLCWNDLRFSWLQSGGLWPCTTMVSLLEQLRSTSKIVFGTGMRDSLISFAEAVIAKQRLSRMKDAYLRNKRQVLEDEQNNIPHSNWNPGQNTDWLLLQIDANICIRPVQVDVAHATISPASKENSVLQMNMGQGKTSCIIPMVAAILADNTRLLRVIVPRALLVQTSQVLQAKLGGLVGREIRHIPFTRRTITSNEMIQNYFKIHNDILSASGVIVGLPEHMMSFKLSGIQRLVDSHIPEAKQMIRIHEWMQMVCRDVLDECDFTLAPRTQLIYPSGTQSSVDGHPHRWETAEKLLELVSGHIWELQQRYTGSIEVIPKPSGGFPIIYFLRRDAEEALIRLLVKDIVFGRASILPLQTCRQSTLVDIKIFISEANIPPQVTKNILTTFSDNPETKQIIFLLRGLIVHRILLLSLKKRWNVQYGLHPQRDPIAVPFTAKGVPSDQAEWGHPDVAILFTCLAFYLGGLELSQVKQCLNNLMRSNDPLTVYEQWIHSSETLPELLRDWNTINTEDDSQVFALWSHLRYQMPLVNYFLNHFVFPKHAKQFKDKLQASGWDIPLSSFNIALDSKNTSTAINQAKAMTTGFSGTNDNRTILPLTIKQQDLKTLMHTNAEVLTFLLRTRQYVVAKDMRGKRLTEVGLLYRLKDMQIRVLIDAGAQILEMDNLTLAKKWLVVDHQAPAAMYFDSENKPMVIYRNHRLVPLLASPYAENLADCLVYLDEAHTRGTDLKIPTNATGALTLGLGQTKDHTVQAAMRLRQLGTTQSIVFFAPPEVHQSILDSRNKPVSAPVDSVDVVYWLLIQTCLGIEQIQPLYFSQGMDFCRRAQAAIANPSYLVDGKQRQHYCNVLRQEEMQTLEELFKPASKAKSKVLASAYAPKIAGFVKELQRRRKGFQDFGDAVHSSALQEVEQEREVAYEIEAVREVQKPPRFKALSFPGLHEDIHNFSRTGVLRPYSSGYQQAFIALKNTGMGRKHKISSNATSSKLFVSKEFSRTVRISVGEYDDNYVRQVNWVIWSPQAETALVIIPEEAELLIPTYQKNKCFQTHLLTYAAPVTREMLRFNNLDFYAIPAMPKNWRAPVWLTIELGILAGRVYFDYAEYEPLCEYLGVTSNHQSMPGDEELVKPEENVNDDTQEANQTFTAKPLSFLQQWLTLRRKGQEFNNTPMGYVCQGKMLNESSPFFTSRKDLRANVPKPKEHDHCLDTEGAREAWGSDNNPDDRFERYRGSSNSRASTEHGDNQAYKNENMTDDEDESDSSVKN